MHTGLAVIESRWWEYGNDSVRPLFETLAGILYGNPHAVRYDMFAEKASLSQIINEVSQDGSYHSIYIGSHGDNGSIYGLGESKISRTELRNILIKANDHHSISGLYFGSCLIATAQNASFWLPDNYETGLEWVAGYTTKVDWVDSSAVDMIFWSKYLLERQKNKSRRRNKKDDIDMIKAASAEMKKLVPNIFTQMGFNVYYRDSGGSVVPVW